MLPGFKLYYKAIVSKTVWYWHKKQTHRPVELNQEPRNKPMLIQSTNTQKGSQEYTTGKRQSH